MFFLDEEDTVISRVSVMRAGKKTLFIIKDLSVGILMQLLDYLGFFFFFFLKLTVLAFQIPQYCNTLNDLMAGMPWNLILY